MTEAVHLLDLQKEKLDRLAELRAKALVEQALKGGGGGGTSDGMDDWKASVEDRLSGLRSDVREVRNWLAGGAAFLLLALAGGFFFLLSEVTSSSDKADAQLAALREGQARIEVTLNERLPAKK